MNLKNFLALLRQAELNFQLKDALDIIVVAFLVYVLWLLIKRTQSFLILIGISILLGIYTVARLLDLYLTSLIFQTIFVFFGFILIVIFQKELRYFFEWIAIWKKLPFVKAKSGFADETLTDAILQTLARLSQNKMGALLVLHGGQPIDQLVSSGISLSGKISVPLLLSIFDPSTPGHDGAVIIKNDRVEKFGVHLPLAEKFNFKDLGTRHRAALGLAERSDALVIVVSEERGTVSLARNGFLKINQDPAELEKTLNDFLQQNPLPRSNLKNWKIWLKSNYKEKAASVSVAAILWFVFVVELGAGIVNQQFSVPIEFKLIPMGFVVENILPQKALITFVGKNQDFKLLNSKSLRVIINVAKPQEGEQKTSIKEDLIQRPSSLRIVDISPKEVKFSLRKE